MEKEVKKVRFVDYAICIAAVTVIVSVFCAYFYNVFIKFQINYATLFNTNILETTSNFHNDIIKVSSSLFTNKEINTYLHNGQYDKNYSKSTLIENTVKNSTLGTYVTDVIVNIPRDDIVFSSMLLGKTTSQTLINEYPELKDIIENPEKGISVTPYDTYLYYSYNDRGRIVTMVMDAISLKSHLISHVYPIFYGTVLLNPTNETIASELPQISKKVMDYSLELKGNSVKIYGNYLVAKNSSQAYSCISFIRISDILGEALQTSSFLIIISTLFFILLVVVSYYFYFKQKILVKQHRTLETTHTDLSIDHIIQKIFSRDVITKNERKTLSDFFFRRNSGYFVPMLVGITDFTELQETNGYDDITMYKYGFENIINEVMTGISEVRTVNMGKELIGVLLYGEVPFSNEKIKSKTEYFESVIRKNFDMNLFSVIGTEATDINSIYEQVPKLIAAQNYRLIKNEDIIFLSEITHNELSEIYPSALQSEMILNINSGNAEKFRLTLDSFADYIIKNESPHAKEWYLKLFLAVTESCRANSKVVIKYNTLETIINCDKLSEMTDMFFDSVEWINGYSKGIENDNKSFSETVKKIIETEFSNPDFCIQSLIDKFGITASYFGKKFKQEFNISFNRYLLEYRLNCAIHLLDETDYTNTKIAQLCGFNSETYFITIFKKNLGISPKEYKSKKRG